MKRHNFYSSGFKVESSIWTKDKKLIEYGLKINKYSALDSESLEYLLKGVRIGEIKQRLAKKFG